MFKYLKYIQILPLIILAIFLFFPQVQAAVIRFNQPITPGGIEEDVGFITCWIGRVGFSLIIIYIILAGIKMMSSGSKPEKFSEAGKMFQYVLIGGLVILGTSVIIDTIAYTLGVRFITPIFCF